MGYNFKGFKNSYTVDKESGCWIWNRPFSNRYPLIRSNDEVMTGHKFSYKHYKGKIPVGQIIRHTCHNKACVNPEHLILGSQKENIRDSLLNGTYNKKGLDDLGKLVLINMYTEGGHTYESMAMELRISRDSVAHYLKMFRNGKMIIDGEVIDWSE